MSRHMGSVRPSTQPSPPSPIRPPILARLLTRRRLGSWLALWLAVSVLLSTTVLVLLIGHLATGALKQSIAVALTERARYAAQQLDGTMFERYREVQFLASRPEFTRPDMAAADRRRAAEGLQSSYPLYAWIGMAGLDGKVLAATGGLLQGVDVAKRPWFSGALAGRHVHDVHDAKLLAKLLPREEGGPPRFVDVAFPVRGDDGRVHGVLAAHLNWRWAEAMRLQIDAAGGSDGETLIVGRDGKVLAGPGAVTGTVVDTAVLEAARRGRYDHAEERWADGRDYLVGGAATHGLGGYPGLGWTVLTRQETRAAYAEVRALQVRVAMVGLAVALAFSLIGWRVSRRITRPLQKAAALAAAIEEGSSHAISVPHGSFTELAALTGAVNTSLSRLKDKERQLTQVNAELEERVAQRTRDVAQSLETVRHNEARIRAILETAHDAFIGMDSAGRITDWNPRAEQLFGWAREEVLGLLLHDVAVPRASRAAHAAGLARFLAGGDSRVVGKRIEVTALRRDGGEFPVAMTIGLIDVNGSRSFGAFLDDISERRRIERELADSERFLRTVADNSPALIAYLDRDEVYRFANRRFETLLGVDPVHMIGKRLGDLVGPQIYGTLRGYIDTVLSGQAVHFETEFAMPGWPGYFMADYIPSIGTDGAVQGFHVMAMDITDRKMAELAQARNERLAQAASRAKSEFVANVSHEIRTPLNAVLGLAHLLDNSALAPQQREYVNMIQSCGKTLVGVIDDVLDFSKIEAGRVDIAALPFEMGEIVEAAATAMRASAKPLELVVDVEPDLPAAFIGDAVRLQQVLLNLVGNALKFTAQGQVVFTVARLGQHGNTATVRFAVRDTGIGIDPEQQTRLFTPFEQADAGISRRFGGTGLGLTIARQLTELMGGRIELSSVPGEGSEFSVTLPLTCAPPPARLDVQADLQPNPRAGAEPAAAALRLLVVEPRRASRASLARAIETLGWTAGWAESATQAVAAADLPVDAVLVDGDAALVAQLRRALAARWPGRAVAFMQLAGGGAPGSPVPDTVPLVRPVTAQSLRSALAGVVAAAPRDVPALTPAVPDRAAELAGVRVLLVEDNVVNQLVAKGILEPAGAIVTTAADGQQAVDLFTTRRGDGRGDFDIVLMDVQMPVMDGYTATRILRTRLGLQLPILAMSAGVTAAEREQCLAVGMNDFIPKPIDVEQMMARIQEHLRQVRPAAQAEAPPAQRFDVGRLAALSARNPAQLQSLVALVARMTREAPAELERARDGWQGGDALAAARILHALRGSVGSLGARRFAAVTVELEAALREGRQDDAARLFDSAGSELGGTTEAARNWLAAQQQPDVPAPAPDAVRRWVRLLRERDLDAATVYETLRGPLAARLDAGQQGAVAAAMAALDFDGVLAVLPATLKESP
ncbi:PAS domain S-box protein [Pseudoduganella umbonata]|uniref:Sensory/regulatory protein RpfC n=1 Tax=Pseudoduganella umbonata TaxID=864828 RepID=A0A4P8HPE5_9BURK|nr:PAS domain S-box protein [Pseudoduganella umbonata]MBB3220188.1 PAS domain S-box-containing protein [Pseudoduganella umbonata]QCP10175.1 PAS domain S-box protein [Pseudoduganella umbonata]